MPQKSLRFWPFLSTAGSGMDTSREGGLWQHVLEIIVHSFCFLQYNLSKSRNGCFWKLIQVGQTSWVSKQEKIWFCEHRKNGQAFALLLLRNWAIADCAFELHGYPWVNSSTS